MDGLLLRLLDDDRCTAGRWFWPCFEPLRHIFDRYYWIFPCQPWMGACDAFDHERELADYEGIGETSISVWRPGAVGRWADRFCEEQIELWATSPAEDAAMLASEVRHASSVEEDAFIENHAEIWLIYIDSTCWEIFAKQADLLKSVRDHLQQNEAVRVYDNNSTDRARAYAAAGIADVWRALHGQL